MKVTIQSTSKVTRIDVEGHKVPAQLWKGTTESGVPIHCYVTLISPQTHDAVALASFARELQEYKVERELVSFDLRMVLCFVKWKDGWMGEEKEHQGAGLGWIVPVGLDSRLHAVVLVDGKFVKIAADKIEFVRWS